MANLTTPIPPPFPLASTPGERELKGRELGKGSAPEEIIVEDVVGHDCMRRVHLMRNTEYTTMWDGSLAEMFGADPMEATVDIEREATGAWHLRAEWQYRGPLDIQWPVVGFHRLVVWSLKPGDRVSQGIQEAAAEFVRLFRRGPCYAYVLRLPRGVEYAAVVPFRDYEILLFDAGWMMERAVAVGYAGQRLSTDSLADKRTKNGSEAIWTGNILAA